MPTVTAGGGGSGGWAGCMGWVGGLDHLGKA